jgi:hypothetical protein
MTSKPAKTWVEFGVSKELGQKVVSSRSGLIDLSSNNQQALLEVLEPGATYHYRVVAREFLKIKGYDVTYGEETDAYSLRVWTRRQERPTRAAMIKVSHTRLHTLAAPYGRLFHRSSAWPLSFAGTLQRCGHPGQQHGLRIPPRILSMPTSMRRFLVSSFFTDVIQQIHSFRASGVISAQILLTAALDSMALRKSGGSLWTVPPAIF